jgi:hypothetical protein
MTPVDRRRFFLTAAAGAALAVVVFVVILLDGHLTPFRVVPPADSFGGHLTQFYDLQAHSLLDLRLDVPSEKVGIEGFAMDDGTYIYFGPWPALLRLPIAAVTHSFDGRLTQPSMFLAFVVALAFTVHLAWRIRGLVLPEQPVGRGEQWMIAAFVFVVGTGSTLVYLGGELLVFHEAALWGAALAIGALDAVIGFTTTGRGRTLAWASVLTGLALFSRPPLGVGPLVALGLLLVVALLGRGGHLVGFPDGLALRRLALPLAAAVLVPLALYGALNVAKFGTPFSLPFERQVVNTFSPGHRAVLAANDGTLVGSQFIPTNLLQYFRPDAVRFEGRWPFVQFPDPAPVLGSVRFDWVTPATSVPTSMPALTALSVVGLVGALTARRPRLWALRAPVLGAVLASVITLGFGFVANRYIADFVPVLVALGLAGLYVLLSWSLARPRDGRTRAVWIGVAVLAVFSVWVSTGLTVAAQRGLETPVVQARGFPGVPTMGTFLVLRDCEGLYRSTGIQWRAVELTPTTGRFRLAATFPAAPESGRREPLVATGRPQRGQVVFVEYRPGGQAVFGYLAQGHGGRRRGAPVPLAPGPHTLDILIEPHVAQVSVRLDDAIVFDFVPASLDIVQPVRRATLGRNEIGAPVARRFTGTLAELPVPTPLCRRLARQAS